MVKFMFEGGLGPRGRDGIMVREGLPVTTVVGIMYIA